MEQYSLQQPNQQNRHDGMSGQQHPRAAGNVSRWQRMAPPGIRAVGLLAVHKVLPELLGHCAVPAVLALCLTQLQAGGQAGAPHGCDVWHVHGQHVHVYAFSFTIDGLPPAWLACTCQEGWKAGQPRNSMRQCSARLHAARAGSAGSMCARHAPGTVRSAAGRAATAAASGSAACGCPPRRRRRAARRRRQSACSAAHAMQRTTQ